MEGEIDTCRCAAAVIRVLLYPDYVGVVKTSNGGGAEAVISPTEHISTAFPYSFFPAACMHAPFLLLYLYH